MKRYRYQARHQPTRPPRRRVDWRTIAVRATMAAGFTVAALLLTGSAALAITTY